ncbi:MAG TPA: hypothetical protein VHN37_08220, partial [Actinomycetota bacterium]|nr:hypothetical protein [Actinomycetota bacterium]
AIRVTTTGQPSISDDEARAMFGLPPKVEDEDAASAARELLGGVGLTAVPSPDGDGVSGDGTGADAEDVSVAE